MGRRPIVTEAGRFLAVGGLATIVALFLFNLLVHGFNTGQHALLDQHPYLAFVIANTVGMVISYRGSRSWAFRERPPRHPDGGRVAFVAINVVTMAIPVACLWTSRNVLGLDDPISDNLSANVVGLLLGLGARFHLFRTFVFKRPIHLTEIYGIDDPELLPPPPDEEGRNHVAGPVADVSLPATGRSTPGPVPPPGP